MSRADFVEGLRGGFTVAVASAPFAALFGALAVDNGMSLSELMLMSATVYAGASQMVGIELFGNNVQAWLIVASILAVNFRHVLYSAAIARYVRHFTPLQKFFTFFLLVDPQFAEMVKRGEEGKPVTFIWYFGFGIIIYVPWVLVSLLGGLLGGFIGDPKALGLDILLPAYFLGIVLGFRNRSNFLPVALVSAVASAIAYHYVGSPWHVSLGAAAGITLAALLPLPGALKPEPENEPHEV
ncbi:branched-chain amino acid transporter AzlC family protein [Rhizobium etli 8C-3]|uniref:Branched-chain amino acid transporter AzlC family protein n=2 Tax=Rhizobium TaxID=379 RepID=A0A1L5P5F3_RHIET|nr:MULTISPECIES: AzlC family ABC transporter permease [Rhizobium]APO75366.1 branched-chain amino acid transporter AzlC family protein [Rhizobium etli 8C-3]TCU25541.1 putative branched-subunit amino acid permease [Rhizobium azibense]TCU40172.1 putative branched-subunit amino acid permease [Rhizobium azibense]